MSPAIMDEPKEQQIRRPRLGEIVIICPKCGSRCTANRSEPSFTRYYCDARCGYMKKLPRP